MPQEAFRLPENVEAALLQQPKLQAPLKKYTVSADEKMLVTVRGELQAVFGTGEYVLHLPAGNDIKALFANSRQPVFDDTAAVQVWAKTQPALVAEHFECVEAGADELKLYFVGGKLAGYIAPDTRTYFWKQAAAPYAIQTVDLKNSLRIDADMQAKLKAADFWRSSLADIVYFFQVPAQHQGLLYINQELQPVLPAGEYYYWSANRELQAEIIDLRPQTCEIFGQELLSEDKVTLRVNAVCNYRITDAPLWLAQHREPEQYLYRELQFAIRAVVGGKTMDQLLADKQAIDAELSAAMRAKHLRGIEISDAGVKDIILPGEIRSILTRVVEAEKSALANNIRRREETASTRSLLNTSRVMEENPVALRLKELETLEKVTEKIDKISVYGGLDGVLNGLININTPKP
ncbi:slipin family protein [Eikenella longinqua]|nr:slipin family protein [Eikenella longinqua]